MPLVKALLSVGPSLPLRDRIALDRVHIARRRLVRFRRLDGQSAPARGAGGGVVGLIVILRVGVGRVRVRVAQVLGVVRVLRQAQGKRYAVGLVQRAQFFVAIPVGAGAGDHAVAGILDLRGRPGDGRFARNEFPKADGLKRTPQ